MIHAMKRLWLAFVGLLLIAPLALGQAKDFPVHPITMIVPYPAGGQTDLEVRSMCAAASRLLNQTIIVVNRPGAGGALGAVALASAPPDGYLLSSIPVGVFRQPYIAKVSYDPRTDLTYIMGTSGYTFGVVVRADSRWKTFKDLLDYAKANPDKLNFATPGVGSTQQITMTKIARQLGIKWNHVPHKGTPENNAALLSGYVDFNADGSGWANLVDAGKFRLLNTWGPVRTKKWPGVPTLKEQGFDLVETSPYGIAGPKGLPPAIVEKLHDAFKKALYDPEHLRILESLSQEIVYMTPAEFTRHAAEQVEIQKQIVEEYKLKP